MLEIELKFDVADFSPVRQQLLNRGARFDEPIVEADYYYNAPDRDFGTTDEAFRLRCIGNENRVTYKGPKLPGPTKIRQEIEIGLEPGEQAANTWNAMVQCLGYRPTARVVKQRTIAHLQQGSCAIQVCLDEVEDIGRFVEIEVVAPSKDQALASKTILEIAKDLQLEEREPRSYLAMVLARL